MPAFRSPTIALKVSLILVFALALPSYNAHDPVPGGQVADVCEFIGSRILSSSQVAYPGDAQYEKDNHHWALSSEQASKCTVEPGTADDVGTILKIVGKTRTPFGVKCGGHASNPDFSSSPGVLIAMSRFNEVKYDPLSETAVVGAGLIFDDVYAALAPYNRTVVGGRVSGIGVAGFTLGGGYSWKTNQYGLGIDTVVAFELVKPNGRVVNVTQKSDPDLFFGLRGGFNNFGIVTRFTMRTFPQGPVWGGVAVYVSNLTEISEAVVKFSESVIDPKAAIISSYVFHQGNALISLLMFYDGPAPPTGIFDTFLDFPASLKNVSTRDYLSLIQVNGGDEADGRHRGLFSTISLAKYTPTIVEAVLNETLAWGSALETKSGFLVSHSVEPFLPEIFSHTSSPSSYPPSRGFGFSPFNLYFAWDDAKYDSDFEDAVKESGRRILQVAIDEGQDLKGSSIYPNYALSDTPLEDIYGKNVHKLKNIKKKVDPENVMGLAGGFKF